MSEMVERVVREPTEREAALESALREARKAIEALHGPVAWSIYEANSPEMKLIDAALAEK